MALASRGRSVLKDENAMPSGKLPVNGQALKSAGGQKSQQLNIIERKTLSDISNTLRASAGTPKPDSNAGNGILKSSSSKTILPPSSQKPSSGTGRAPLRNISNEVQTNRPSTQSKIKAGNQARTVGPAERNKSGSKIKLTEEMKQNAKIWAQDGIENVYGATGHDMELRREKLMDEEIEKRVTQVLAFRTDLPSMYLRRMDDEPIEFDDGLMKPDILKYDLDEFGCPKFPGSGLSDLGGDNMIGEPVIPENSIALLELSDSIDSIPADWHIVPEVALT